MFVKVTHIENYFKLIIWCTLLAISRQGPQNSFKEYADEVSDMSETCSKSLATLLTCKLHHIALIINVPSVGWFCVRLETKLHHIVLIVFVHSMGGFCIRLETKLHRIVPFDAKIKSLQAALPAGIFYWGF